MGLDSDLPNHSHDRDVTFAGVIFIILIDLADGPVNRHLRESFPIPVTFVPCRPMPERRSLQTPPAGNVVSRNTVPLSETRSGQVQKNSLLHFKYESRLILPQKIEISNN